MLIPPLHRCRGAEHLHRSRILGWQLVAEATTTLRNSLLRVEALLVLPGLGNASFGNAEAAIQKQLLWLVLTLDLNGIAIVVIIAK